MMTNLFIRRVAAITLLVLPAIAWPVNKCIESGRVVYQDRPCKMETVREGVERRKRMEELHRYLDQIQATGVGRRAEQHKQTAKSKSDSAAQNDEEGRYYRPVPRGVHQPGMSAREVEARTQRSNAESAARLGELMRKAEEFCNGPLAPLPKVGMTDEYFRVCTEQRFQYASQVVAVTHENKPLRLYVYESGKVLRVYSVDGVVTKVWP